MTTEWEDQLAQVRAIHLGAMILLAKDPMLSREEAVRQSAEVYHIARHIAQHE